MKTNPKNRRDIRFEDLPKALKAIGNPNVNPFKGKVDIIIIETGSSWILLGLKQSQIDMLKRYKIIAL